MPISSFNKISDTIIRVKQLLILLVAELNDAEIHYRQLSAEATQTYEGSCHYWENYKQQETERLSKETGDILFQIDEMMERILDMEKQLCQVDKIYADRKDTDLALRTTKIRVNTHNTDFLGTMRSMLIRVQQLAEECSLSVRIRPIQEIEMMFSGRRMQKYMELYDLIANGKVTREVAFRELQQKLKEQKARIAEKCDMEISKAADETAELIESIELARENKFQSISNNAHNYINSVLSKSDVEALTELAGLTGQSPERMPNDFCECITIGHYKLSLSEILMSPVATSLANDLFVGHIEDNSIVLPAIINLHEGLHYAFDAAPAYHVHSRKAIHSLMFSLLQSAPASRQTFMLFDPENRSRGFDTYLDFIKKYPDVMGGQVSTTQAQMRAVIDSLTHYVDTVGQTKFVGFSDIYHYNTAVVDKQESLKSLCILNFPKYFDEHMLDNLLNIINNGSEYGVQVLIQIDSQYIDDKLHTSYSLIKKILQRCHNVYFNGEKYILDNNVELSLNAVPSKYNFSKFNEIFTSQYNVIKSAILPINKIMPTNKWFEGDSRGGLSIPIGKNEDGNIHCLEFGDSVANGTSHYALIVGSTGSGKSTLLHTLIMNAITKYGPDELIVYLMDFKSGTEFKIYTQFEIPHIKLLALDAMQEFGQSILDELWSIMQSRAAIFKEALKDRHDIKDIEQYREMTGIKMPRILVIADEFQLLFNEDNNRKVANACGIRMADFVSLARVYGIHFVFSTQTLSRLSNGFSIRKSTMSEMHVRIGLQCSEAESRLLFGDTFAKEAFLKMGSEKGSAVYTENDVRSSPIGFKVAYCNKETQQKILSDVERQYALMNVSNKMKVFEGESVPLITSCPGFENPDPQEALSNTPIFMGEPIKIAPPLTINVNRVQRNNLLICGGNHEMLDRLTALYVLNAIKSHPYKLAASTAKTVFLCDGSSIIGEQMGHHMRAAIGNSPLDVKTARSNTEVLSFIDELYELYESRRSRKLSQTQNCQFNTVHLIFNNFQWIDAVNLALSHKSVEEYAQPLSVNNASSDMLFGFVPINVHPNDQTGIMDELINQTKTSRQTCGKSVSYHKKILTLIESGYTYGITVVISCPDLLSIKEYIYEVIPKFQHRIIFAINNNDADRLVPEAKVENLRSNIVVYTDGLNSPIQFKPYTGVESLFVPV